MHLGLTFNFDMFYLRYWCSHGWAFVLVSQGFLERNVGKQELGTSCADFYHRARNSTELWKVRLFLAEGNVHTTQHVWGNLKRPQSCVTLVLLPGSCSCNFQQLRTCIQCESNSGLVLLPLGWHHALIAWRKLVVQSLISWFAGRVGGDWSTVRLRHLNACNWPISTFIYRQCECNFSLYDTLTISNDHRHSLLWIHMRIIHT